MDAIADTLQMPSVELVTTTDLLMLQQKIEQLEETTRRQQKLIEELQATVSTLNREVRESATWFHVDRLSRRLDDHINTYRAHKGY